MPGTETFFSTTKIWPTDPRDQEKIPLWMKFFCYDYSDNSFVRTSRAAGLGPMLKCIMVPAPKELVNTTDALYNTAVIDDTGKAINMTKADPRDSTLGKAFGAIEDGATGLFFGLVNPFTFMDTFTAIGEMLGFGAKIAMDMSDTKFVGVAKRTFNIKLLFVSKTPADSSAAAEICEIFEAFSLPQARMAPLSKFVCHPPLWKFGVGPGNGPIIDPDWSGQPQLSLLDAVTVNRSGVQDSFGVANERKDIKPLAITANIKFVELEPAMRSSLPQSSTIINRSVAFWTAGGIPASLGPNVTRAFSRLI